MLQTSRDNITGIFAYIVLGAIAVVFVLWGINYREQGATTYAAKVNGERISIEAARSAWQRQAAQFRGQLPPEMEKPMQQSILDQLIRSKVLELRADKLGYAVGDSALINRLQAIPAFQVEGKFSRQ